MQRWAVDQSHQDYFKGIFRQLPERKLIIRADSPVFTVEEITDSYASMLGIERETIVGLPYFEAFINSSEDISREENNLLKGFKAIIALKKPQVQQIFRHDFPHPDNPELTVERYWRTTLYPILGKNGKVSHILQVSSNATQEVLATRELQEAKQHLDEALEIGKVGSWSWDIFTNLIVGNAGFATIFGIDEGETITGLTLDKFLQSIHEEDRDRVMNLMQHAINMGVIFDTEFRIVNRNGESHWVIGRGSVVDIHGTKRLSGVTVDVTERRDLQTQIELAKRQDKLNRAEARLLQQRNEELENLSRSKNEFVALASHQLRTPATAVKQYLGMVLQGYAGEVSESQLSMLNKAFESNERQIQIVNQILNAARADTGRLVMTMSPFNLSSLLKAIADDFREQIEAHAHTITVSVPKKEVNIEGDQGYVRMVIENLLSNADKYTPDDGQIHIKLRDGSKRVRISVTDTGVGIDSEDLDRLFVKFSRIHNPLSVQAGGSGIGLYLAAEIVRLHGGKIEVDSTPGIGTTFSVSLPKKQETIIISAK